MKSLRIVVIALTAILMASCDANKSKVKEISNKFVEAVISGDKVTIYELYPTARDYENLALPESLTADDVSVEFNKIDSFYIVALNDRQKLALVETKPDKFQIFNSYGILKLDSLCYELGVLTGTPLNDMSDMTKGRMFSNDGSFMKYLAEEYPTAANGNLSAANGFYSWKGGRLSSCQIEQPVTNNREKAVEYDDYTLEFIFYETSTRKRVGTATQSGPALAAGETYVTTVYKDDLIYYAKRHD